MWPAMRRPRRMKPHLDPMAWLLPGRASTSIVVTASELERLEAAIEQLLSPYVLRKNGGTAAWPRRATALSGSCAYALQLAGVEPRAQSQPVRPFEPASTPL